MEEFREDDFGWQRVVGRVVADRPARFGVARGRVARLNHEIADDAMPEIAVVVALSDEFQEVVAMERRFVVEFEPDVSHRGFEEHFAACKRVGVLC